jgi:hypothetical protein
MLHFLVIARIDMKISIDREILDLLHTGFKVFNKFFIYQTRSTMNFDFPGGSASNNCQRHGCLCVNYRARKDVLVLKNSLILKIVDT